jgi:16S rRNA (cytosine1402-N4)-methyltransferase
MEHKPVMAGEIISIFADAPDGVFIDATFGLGGHTRAMLGKLRGKFSFVGIDRDAEMLERAGAFPLGTVSLYRMNYTGIPELISREGLGPVTGILFDLGVNSAQLDDPSRGFSFEQAATLDMRYDQGVGKSAAELLSGVDQENLVRILKDYGQEKKARSIARAIISERPSTTDSLAAIIRRIVGPRNFVKSAARVFQALRIAINNELLDFKTALEGVIPLMAGGGRLAVISYHSLEDRIVKRLFQLYSGKCFCGPEATECTCGRQELLTIKTRKPVRPSPDEIKSNSRARPARLRYAEKK